MVESITIATEPRPVVLRLRDVDAVTRDAYEQERANRTVALDDVTVRFTVREGRLTVQDATLRTADHSVAAPALRDALDSVDVETRTPDRDLRQRRTADRTEQLAAPRIILRDVRGVQIGDHNVQINRFIARNEELSLDFEEVLRRTDVRVAIRSLQRDPSDNDRRKDLERVLRDNGWSFFPKRQFLEARSEGERGLLRGLVSFESRGLQIGDGGEQRNTFVYRAWSPDAAELLRGDRDVARALTVYLCPRTDGDRDFEVLRGVLERSISELPIRWDRDRLVQYRAPRAGETVRVERADAVSIGDFRSVRSTEERDIRIARRRTAIPKPTRDLPDEDEGRKAPSVERTRDAEDDVDIRQRQDWRADRDDDFGFDRGY
ncbi:hypothetical protein [Paractinoplanes lichenicola]|uniref:DUF2382 domain-containing protein n=1 Tax=Paractinoplanes lichenicola TaxID=2802976 RepID=A0ABS1VF00_9ACTN|nr:hypothetical protein [Actinoplanes lichenicola]MBL7253264.1 hypothetical protein [Actinoplanes lichenicola]